MAPTTYEVHVSYEDDDHAIYGPYTEAQANRVADRLLEEIALTDGGDGRCRHPHNVIGAYASPMTRYDQFLTGPERRAARREARAARSENSDS